MIRPALYADAGAIAHIYNHYIENTVISFEEEPVSAEEITRRMGDLESGWPWLVADENEEQPTISGYAYAGQWSGRCAYRSSAEVSVYVAPDQTNRGIGSQLYTRLLADLCTRGTHTVVGGIALPNVASVALHEHFGFTKVAHYKEIGYKFGRWIDVGYWQLMLAEAKDSATVTDCGERDVS